jgi:hypothetical protein
MHKLFSPAGVARRAADVHDTTPRVSPTHILHTSIAKPARPIYADAAIHACEEARLNKHALASICLPLFFPTQ